MTTTEKESFQKGFKVALNFIANRPGNDKTVFKNLILAQEKKAKKKKVEAILDEAIALTSTMESSDGCGPGECRVGGNCVPCAFLFAFDGTFHS
jgi:hypothetical protein